MFWKLLGKFFANNPKFFGTKSPFQSMGTWKQNMVDRFNNIVVVVKRIVFEIVHNFHVGIQILQMSIF
jgi:hypothetical protein